MEKIKITWSIIIINIVVIFIASFLSSFLTSQFAKKSELETRRYEMKKEASVKLLTEIISFSDFNNVDWKKYSEEYRPYNCDWPKEYNVPIGTSSTGVFCEIWAELQNAKKDFNNRTIEARVLSSNNLYNSIENMTNGFDEVFVAVVANYYFRSFIDNYNEIMRGKFNDLELIIREELGTK